MRLLSAAVLAGSAAASIGSGATNWSGPALRLVHPGGFPALELTRRDAASATLRGVPNTPTAASSAGTPRRVSTSFAEAFVHAPRAAVQSICG